VVVLLIATVSYFTGKEHGLERYYDFKSTVEKESELLRLENERQVQAVTEAARQVADDYAKARAALAAGPRVVRVRDTCSGSGILPGVSTASPGIDATTEAGTIDPAQCETYLNAGIADAAQLMFLQQWATQIHEASKQ
jgi:hypothetical protein